MPRRVNEPLRQSLSSAHGGDWYEDTAPHALRGRAPDPLYVPVPDLRTGRLLSAQPHHGTADPEGQYRSRRTLPVRPQTRSAPGLALDGEDDRRHAGWSRALRRQDSIAR